MAKVELAAGSGSSVLVRRCQICDNESLRSVFFLGYLPPVNRQYPAPGEAKKGGA